MATSEDDLQTMAYRTYRGWTQTGCLKKHYNINQKGRRHIGRPRRRWRDQCHFEDTRNRNQT